MKTLKSKVPKKSSPVIGTPVGDGRVRPTYVDSCNGFYYARRSVDRQKELPEMLDSLPGIILDRYASAGVERRYAIDEKFITDIKRISNSSMVEQMRDGGSQNLVDNIAVKARAITRSVMEATGEMMVNWSLVCGETVYTFTLAIDLIDKKNTYQLTFETYDENCEFVRIRVIGWFDDKHPHFIDLAGGPIFYAIDPDATTKYIKSIPYNDGLSIMEGNLINQAMLFLRNNMSNTNYLNSFTKLEVAVFSDIARHRKTSLVVNSRILHLDSKYMDGRTDEEYNGYREHAWACATLASQICDWKTHLIPLIDLSLKEQDFIRRFSEQRGMMTEDPTPFDLDEIMIDPRYGRRVVQPFKDRFGNVVNEYVVDCAVLEDRETLDVMIGEVGDHEFVGNCVWLRFTDIHHFTGPHNLAIAILINYQNISDNRMLDADPATLFDRVPVELTDKTTLIHNMLDVFAMYVTMYHRPTRTRMIRETRAIWKNPQDEFTGGEPSEYVVRRLMKSVADVRKYEEEMNQYSGHRHVEYVIESWKRDGHWRRLPGKDVKIWIHPTTCHRHLDRVEKEVHIKL